MENASWRMDISFYIHFYNKVEFNFNANEYNLQKGNLILQILSTKKNLNFQTFSEIMDSIETNEKFGSMPIFSKIRNILSRHLLTFMII